MTVGKSETRVNGDVIVRGKTELRGDVTLPDETDLLERLRQAETRTDALAARLSAVEARLPAV